MEKLEYTNQVALAAKPDSPAMQIQDKVNEIVAELNHIKANRDTLFLEPRITALEDRVGELLLWQEENQQKIDGWLDSATRSINDYLKALEAHVDIADKINERLDVLEKINAARNQAERSRGQISRVQSVR